MSATQEHITLFHENIHVSALKAKRKIKYSKNTQTLVDLQDLKVMHKATEVR